jgi:hypothetical protein
MTRFSYRTAATSLIVVARLLSAMPVSTQSGLKIVVVEGEDAVNIIQQKTAVAPVVEVRDRNDQPVAGAVVNFAIRGGRATFGGARTLSVTTNIAGRAVASGLTPTASGALQISASAAFQGQTAVVAITQTNVMTAAQAAAVSSAAGSSGGGTAAGTGAGAAGGGGGGMSVTTIGIIGGAAAGGAVVATKALSGPGGTAFTGQYAGNIVVTGPAPFCGFTERVSGTVVLRIEDPAAASLTGTAEINETTTTIYNPICQLPNGSPFQETHKPPISGSAASVGFNFTRDNTFTAPNGTTGVRTKTMSFTGSLNGSEIAGVLTNTESNRSTSGPPLPASGTTAFPITLR